MTLSTTTDKKVSQSDRWTVLIGKIIAAIRNDGFTFSARLNELCGDEAWFESKTGINFMVRRSQIVEIREVVPKNGRR